MTVVKKSVLLRGLQSQPLATYLAALGVLRICAEQWDERLRARWSPEGFVIDGVDEDELVTFLVERYEPTPLVAPWAGGAGFAEGEDTTSIDAIRGSTDSRLTRYRAVIEAVRGFPELPPRGLLIGDVRAWAAAKVSDAQTKEKVRADLRKLLEDLASSNARDDLLIDDCKQGHPAAKIFTQLKAERRQGNKSAIAGRCRNELPDECVRWVDAAVVLFVNEKGELADVAGPLSKDARKPRQEFSRLFMEAVSKTILGDRQQSLQLARGMLTGATVAGLMPMAPGMFELGSAGGFNMGTGFSSSGVLSNPWTITMTFEGCVAWSGSVSRRAGEALSVATVGPFTTRHVPAASAAASSADADSALTEIWTPLWERPASAAEVLALLAEGRASVAGRGPQNAVEFAEAVASLGVDRGIASFVRFAILERRGPSFVASPLGRLRVAERREVDLLDQLDHELRHVERFFRGFPSETGPPTQLINLRRRIDDARFEVAARGGHDAMTRLVRAVGALEMALARRDPGKEPRLPRPLGGLGVNWIDACGDSVEVRIAAALSSIAPAGGAGPVRSYLAPLDPGKPWKYAAAARSLPWAGVDIAERLANVLRRRVLDVRARGAGERTADRNPTWGVRRATLGDLALFLAPDLIDDTALEELFFGFTWVKQDAMRIRPLSREAPPLPRDYALLKLLFLPNGIPQGTEHLAIAADGTILSLLHAGRIADAVTRASSVLRAKGLRPRRVVDPRAPLDPKRGQRLAAALLIPLAQPEVLVEVALRPADDNQPEERITDAG